MKKTIQTYQNTYLTIAFLFLSFLGMAQIVQRGTATTATSGGTSLIITKPTGIALGDIMIANISESDNAALSVSVSSTGWTLIHSRTLGVTNMKGTVLYKIAVASDVTAANYTFTLSTGTDSASGAIIAFSGVNTTTPFDVTPGTINTTNAASITATGITTVTANTAIIMLGQVGDDRSYSAWTTTSPGTLTELYDINTTTGNDSSVGGAWAVKATAGATGNGTATLSGSNRNGAILLALKQAPPTITSLGASSGCVGSSITINGRNLTGATAAGVTIGGTAVSSIISNTGTVLVAVVGSGTTGTVSVTASGGTATIAGTFTVNALPSNPGNPTSNSPQCISPGVTLTRNGSVPSGETWYWQTTSLGTATTSSAATYNVTSSGTYYIRSLNTSTGCWSSGQGSLTVVVNTVPTAAITPFPATTATGICYAGPGTVTGVSWTATAGATSYDVYFGAGSLPGTVTSNVATNSYSTGTLLASTTYYWKVVAKNACGDATGSSTWTFTTKAIACYCIPNASSGVDGTGITNVTYSTNVNNITSDTGDYNDYTATQIGNVVQGASMPISVTISVGKKTYNLKIWVDWNNDGDFDDSGEEMYSTNTSNTSSDFIAIPLTASLGYHTMRVGIAKYKKKVADNEIPIPCFNGTNGAYEDYTLNITAAAAGCTIAPIVSTNPSNASIANGANTSFTAAFTNTPNNYIWEVSTDGGTNYSVIVNGGKYSTATTQTLTVTAASFSMNGFKYRASASNSCGTSDTSTVATLTITGTYCTPSTPTASTYWIANVSSVGNLKDTAYTGSPAWATSGYGNYSSTIIATQTPGGGVNFSITLASSVPPGTTRADRQRFICYVDWNGDGDFIDTGEQVYTTGNTGILQTTFGFVVPLTQASGNYRMRIRSSRQTGTISGVCPGAVYPTGETEDYTISVVPDCASKIESTIDGIVCGANNTVTLSAVGLGGAIEYRWYDVETEGTALTTTTVGSWTTPPLPATKTYYVTSFNGNCESLVRTPVVATVIPTTILNFTPSEPIACGEDSILTINATGDTTVIDLFTNDFENGTLGGFTVTTTTNLYDTNGDQIGDSAQPNAPWSVKTNTYQPTDTSVWIPAISSGSIGENFAYTTSDYSYCSLETYISTGDLNTSNYLDLTLTFKHYYSDYSITPGDDEGTVEVSTNGGSSWTTTVATYDSDLGSASKFTNVSIDLTPYVGISNFRFRYKYKSGWADGWAIDDVRVFGTKAINTAFTWTSPPDTTVDAFTDLACTTPYIPGISPNRTTIYLKPDLSQLEATTFPITITAILDNTCPVSQTITVANNSRVWKGTASSDWNAPGNWKPAGVPTSDNCVIVPATTLITGTDFQAYGKNLTVKPAGILELQVSNNLTISDWIHVETGGQFYVRNNASLVQINDDVNTGIVNIDRTTKPMNYYDYSYWNSPVTAASNFTLGQLSPGSTYMYSWLPFITTGPGNWQEESPSTIMTPSKGYIVKAPESFSSSIIGKVAHTGTFLGTPNNGPVSATISKGTLTGTDTEDDEWNLIGNPYASGINATTFLNLPANAAVIEGTIYVWTHNSQPSALAPDPFYNIYGDYALNYSSDDYAAFNTTGATATAAATSGGTAPTGFIASGQSFLVKAIGTMADGGSADVTYNNSMRVTSKNSDFFKTPNTKTTTQIEKHRIWLNLISKSGDFNQILVGYVAGATQEKDRSFDGESYGGNNVTFYSIIPEANLVIQGRALPFETNDQVALGYSSEIAGELSIRIDHIDGLFDNQDVFLEDKTLDIIHDLKKTPYYFNTEVGEFNSRFTLRYTDKTLGTNSFESTNAVKVIVNQNVIVKSSKQLIKNITVYDLAGRKIDSYKKVNSSQYTLNHLNKNSVGLIVKITLDNDEVVSKKIIY